MAAGATSLDQLKQKSCVPCEGDVPRLTREQAERQLEKLDGWQLGENADSICKQWVVKNFMAGLHFFNQVARLAEEEGHHPDLHLAGYRNARIEISTHAIGGLSENDFILAAKIDDLPVELKGQA